MHSKYCTLLYLFCYFLGNLCEHECNTVEDCIKGEALCSKNVGYKCE